MALLFRFRGEQIKLPQSKLCGWVKGQSQPFGTRRTECQGAGGDCKGGRHPGKGEGLAAVLDHGGKAEAEVGNPG